MRPNSRETARWNVIFQEFSGPKSVHFLEPPRSTPHLTVKKSAKNGRNLPLSHQGNPCRGMQNVPFCDPKSGPGTHADDSKSSAICGCSRDPAGKKLTARGTQKVENRVAKVCQAETIIGHFNPTRPCYSSLPSQIFHTPEDGGVPSNVPCAVATDDPRGTHLTHTKTTEIGKII